MLVLERYVDEAIVINTSDGIILVKLCNIKGKRANIGIVAPPECKIARPENTPGHGGICRNGTPLVDTPSVRPGLFGE